MEIKKAIPYEIVITPTANNGFLVKVGCAKLAYASPGALVKDLKEYLKAPKEIEAKYQDLCPGPTQDESSRPGLFEPMSNQTRLTTDPELEA